MRNIELLNNIVAHETIRRKYCKKCGSRLFLEKGVEYTEWACCCCGFREDFIPPMPLVKNGELI